MTSFADFSEGDDGDEVGAKAKLTARVSLQPMVGRLDMEEDDCGLWRGGRKVS